MPKTFKLVWLYSVLVASITVASTVSATEVPDSTAPIDGMGTVPAVAAIGNLQPAEPQATSEPQVTSVSQLSDVRPTDWAFQALQSLVERYGCIAGYPDKTYRGNRALTRYEFAAGLNACLDRVNELIAASTTHLVKKEDLVALQKLQEQFAAELATFRGRVDTLEVRTATLERQQFSTTTTLNGEVVIAATGVLSGRNIRQQRNGEPVNERVARNIVLGDRIQLDLNTSFTGRDLLRMRLLAVNLPALPQTETGTLSTREGALRAVPIDNAGNNSLGINTLFYQFPVGEQMTVTLAGNTVGAFDFVNTINPTLDGNGGRGALSQFGSRNSIYCLLGGTGLGLQYRFSDSLDFLVGYLASDPANPGPKGGLFNGPSGSIAQLTVRPSDRLELGFTYVHAYNNDFTANGFVGTNRANFRNLAPGILAADVPTSANAYGAAVAFRVAPQVVVNGSVGYTNARSLSRGNSGNLDIWNWIVGLSVLDVGKKGNLLGLMVGQGPHVVGSRGNFGRAVGTDDPSIDVEALFEYQINDHISISPDILWLTAPNGSRNSDSILIGTIRTTFTF